MLLAEDLKKSVLQYAFQGRLVMQSPEDGSADELFQNIQREKNKLIDEKKIKKDKAFPKITEDEVPFDIPNTWKWCRLSQVIDVRDGTHDSPKYVSDGIPLVTSKNLSESGIDYIDIKYISQEDADKINIRSAVDDGDILFAMIGSIGNPVLVKKDRQFCIKNMALFKKYPNTDLDMEYVHRFLYYAQYALKAEAYGGVQSFISLTRFREYPFPLPPIKEQKRIVKKLDALLPVIDMYGEAEKELENLQKAFPDDIRKSVLQYAMQGKLVEQCPEEGTGEELYQQIVNTKLKYIEEGKIKKEKALKDISESEIPFDIPDSWKWVRLGSLLQVISDGTHKTPKYVNEGIPFLSVQNISKGYFDLSAMKYITREEHEKLVQRVKPQKDDILFCRIGTLGKAIKCTLDFEFSIFVSLGLLRPVEDTITDYIIMVINSPVGDKWIQENKVGGGTHTFKINLTDIPNMLIPLPPLQEQRRIVKKLQAILPLVDKLSEVV